MQYVHACIAFFQQVLHIFSAQKRDSQRKSRHSEDPFSSLFPVQPNELFAHTIQTLLRKLLLISSWALLWCSLLQYRNASQILMHLFLYHSPGHVLTQFYWPGTMTQGQRLKISPSAHPDGGMGGWFSAHRGLSSTLHIQHDSCVHNASPTEVLFGRGGEGVQLFRGRETLALLGLEIGRWAAVSFYHPAVTSATSHNFWHSPKVAQLFFFHGTALLAVAHSQLTALQHFTPSQLIYTTSCDFPEDSQMHRSSKVAPSGYKKSC